MPDKPNFAFRVHASLRMAERGITRADVEEVVLEGEAIEQYDEDTPYPSRLFLGTVGGRPLHVVAAWNAAEREWIVVTAYEPDPAKWYPNFKRRRR